MAKVYKAFDRRLEVYREIKILSPAYATHPEIRKRLGLDLTLAASGLPRRPG